MTMNSSFVEQVNTPNAMPPEELARVQAMYEQLLLETDTQQVTGRIARTYAEALLTVAEQRGEVDAIAEQFDSLVKDVFPASPEIERFLASPVASKRQKDEALTRLFGGRATPLFLDFLRLLNRKDRLSNLRLVAVAYRSLREQKANVVRIVVETPVPLQDDQQAAIKANLLRLLNKIPVLVIRIVPELIGGLVIHAGDRVFDTSIRTKLQDLRTQLLARGSHEIQSGRDRFGSN